jgi:hypothetical protein
MDGRTRTSSYNLDLLDLSPFGTDSEIEISVLRLESEITEANFIDILEDLIPRENLLELIFSGKSMDRFTFAVLTIFRCRLE